MQISNSFIGVTLVFMALVLGCGEDSDLRTFEDAIKYQQEQRVRVDVLFSKYEAAHPECAELGERWHEAERNVLCGKCGKPLYPNGMGYLVEMHTVCPHCGAWNGEPAISFSGVTRIAPATVDKYYQPVGMQEWNDLRHEYFYCLGWWKKDK